MNKIIREALKEDIGKGDITSKLVVPSRKKIRAVLLSKGKGIFCGIAVAKQIFNYYKIKYVFLLKDGAELKKGDVIAELTGNARKILMVERVVLNFLQRLSAIASLTNQFVEAVKPYKVGIYDTRKTTPGLRVVEKYAVICGGGHNHRFGLDDMILIKDNHLKLAGSWERMVESLKQKPPRMLVEIEAENLSQVQEILKAGCADIILLDNMALDILKKAIELIRRDSTKPLIEISGGVTLENVKQYARLGVDRISVGALTHSVKALDLSLEII